MIRDLLALTKPGIVRMVALTAAVGFLLARTQPVPWAVLPWLVLGTLLVAGGTNGLNQWWERDIDARMRRTARRPLPSGRLGPGPALAWSLGLAAAGVTVLWFRTRPVTAALALATLVSYVLMYTPLKTRTPHATLVGAVPGALPIVGGWTAAGGALDQNAWVLFALMFFWQVPHFLALGHLYADDYRAGGIRLFAAGDGRAAGRQAVLYAGLLAWASALAATRGGGTLVVAGCTVAAALLIVPAARFAQSGERARARALFLGSLVHLPVVLVTLVLAQYL